LKSPKRLSKTIMISALMLCFVPPLVVLSELAMGIEPYMSFPLENPQGHEYGSNLAIASNLEGNLLVIHGTADLAAPFSGTMQLAEALVRANKRFSLIVLPEERHGFSSVLQKYWQDSLRAYFQKHLHP
jgi:dipeptidyl aminopeptidase/acylaminoacyl peptidase